MTRITLILALSLSLVGSAALTARADHIWHTYNGHNYALTSQHQSWVANEAEAVAAGGHLVAINDEAENAWLTATFSSVYSTEQWAPPEWFALADIGLYRLSPSDPWQWADGEPLDSALFDGHKYAADMFGGNEAYMHVDPHPYAGTWNADPPHTSSSLPAGHGALGIIEVNTPEPTTGLLIAGGLIGRAIVRRRRRMPR